MEEKEQEECVWMDMRDKLIALSSLLHFKRYMGWTMWELEQFFRTDKPLTEEEMRKFQEYPRL